MDLSWFEVYYIEWKCTFLKGLLGYRPHRCKIIQLACSGHLREPLWCHVSRRQYHQRLHSAETRVGQNRYHSHWRFREDRKFAHLFSHTVPQTAMLGIRSCRMDLLQLHLASIVFSYQEQVTVFPYLQCASKRPFHSCKSLLRDVIRSNSAPNSSLNRLHRSNWRLLWLLILGHPARFLKTP